MSLTNTRMPLECIGRPVALRNISRFLIVLVLGAILVGCGSGTAQESNTLEEREASRTAIVPIVQATTEARFIEGSPQANKKPTPTQTPVPMLADLTLATSLNPDNSPGNEVRNVGGGQIFAAAKIHSVTKGTVFTAVWGKTDGTAISRTEVKAAGTAGDQWFGFSWDGADSQPPGTYAVFIYADQMLIGSLTFEKS